MGNSKKSALVFRGCNFFRQRIVLSILSGKTIKITDIRSNTDKPGIQLFEIGLLRLVDSLTNGTTFHLNEDGTTLTFEPGLLIGGVISFNFERRSIGYYLELIFMLAPFFKEGLTITLKGATHNEKDPSVDAFKYGALPILLKFITSVADKNADIIIETRAIEPDRRGKIIFTCPKVGLKPVLFMDNGKIKRIRGAVFSSSSGRIIETAKGVLLKFLPDVFLDKDIRGRNYGLAACLVAESTTGVFLTADSISCGKGVRISAEDFGEKAAFLLLEEIGRGGCVDSSFQSLVCLYMALQKNDVSQCLLGPLSPYTVQFLRHLKDFFNVTFHLEPQIEHEAGVEHAVPKVAVTCVGVGLPKVT